MKQKKSPIVAAILNAILWGTGYLYNGKRIGFGVALLLADLILNFATFFSLMVVGKGELISSWAFLLLAIAFAYDAYREAEEINKSK